MSAETFEPVSALCARLPTESALLVCAAAGPLGEPRLRQLLQLPVQWSAVLRLAARERAVSPLYRRLESLPAGSVPPDEMAKLQRFALISEFQLTSLHDRLAKILEVFSSVNIEAVLLKGAGLAYSAYAQPTDRPMGDIDLLVSSDTASDAWALAVKEGWVRRRDVAEERSYADHQHLTPLEDAEGMQLGLELHTALFTKQAPFLLPPEQIWGDTQMVRLGAVAALVPSPESQLLHAALHFAWSHEMTFGAWRTLRDVERLAASGDFQWESFVAKANAVRGATCCYWTLRLARELVGAAVPSAVLEALAPRLPALVLRRLTRTFALQAFPIGGVAPRSVSLSRALWSLAIQPRAQGHGDSRPWLDTEEWVRDGGEMKGRRRSAVQRFFQRGIGLLR